MAKSVGGNRGDKSYGESDEEDSDDDTKKSGKYFAGKFGKKPISSSPKPASSSSGLVTFSDQLALLSELKSVLSQRPLPWVGDEQ